ncbi:hypothetical protein GPECTOR_10g1027 [Gonium pectorale]|uniref:U-box domain-containing protein n=1 Tax=Gonium pectorale TaxID=33097 RepID=A0A150GQB5_GONPE|nr:hypothetical protein GPECTOR_10g1027 [Gonium pectorale]|eukprot:KXZ52005.1 hypothetical protein GPECTOR_10g1027 [Gonium pectorale]
MNHLSGGAERRGDCAPRLLLLRCAALPSAFVCPLSRRLMSDPVLDPGDHQGRCVERSAFEEHQRRHGVRPLTGLPPLPEVRTYDSLRVHIEGFLEENALSEDVKSRPAKRARLEAPAAAAPADRGPCSLPAARPPADGWLDIRCDEVPASFFCPLSRCLVQDPVVDRNDPRVTWERAAIARHLEEAGGVNPLTDSPMGPSDLLPSTNMRSAIGLWMRKSTRVQPLATQAPTAAAPTAPTLAFIKTEKAGGPLDAAVAAGVAAPESAAGTEDPDFIDLVSSSDDEEGDGREYDEARQETEGLQGGGHGAATSEQPQQQQTAPQPTASQQAALQEAALERAAPQQQQAARSPDAVRDDRGLGQPRQQPPAPRGASERDSGPTVGRLLSGLVTAHGGGAHAALEGCTLEVMAAGGAGTDKGSCAVASGGGSLALQDCRLVGAPCCGLVATGLGSRAAAVLTVARHNGIAGFLAVSGGAVGLQACHAEESGYLREAAVPASATDGHNTAAVDMKALNKWLRTANDISYSSCGFAAVQGGLLNAGDGCVAAGCKRDGFFALGQGAQLRAGKGCRSVDSGRAGFWAERGGAMALGERCVAQGSRSDGFIAMGADTELAAGAGCRALGNGFGGFTARAGAALTAGAGCEAQGNGGAGFATAQRGSRLLVGPRSRAGGNPGGGFRVETGASLAVLHGCEAADNGGSGFTACSGGQLEAGEGCAAAGNEEHGFVVKGASSKLIAGRDCRAVRHEEGWGFLATDHGAVLILGKGWSVEANGCGGAGAEMRASIKYPPGS